MSTEITVNSTLGVKTVAPDVYENKAPLKVPFAGVGVFGGTLVAQALNAALHTVDSKFVPISMHCNFLIAVRPDSQCSYRVERVRDGRNFCTRQVRAFQADRCAFLTTISFQSNQPEGSSSKAGRPINHHRAPPTVGKDIEPLDECFPQPQLIKEWLERAPENPRLQRARKNPQLMVDKYEEEAFEWFLPRDLFDLSLVSQEQKNQRPSDRSISYYVKAREPIETAKDQYVGLAYISDYFFLNMNSRLNMREMYSPKFSVSLDHSIYFHERFDLHQWTTFTIRSLRCGDNRALMMGEFFTAEGKLAATIVQEGLNVIPERESKL